MPTHEIWQKSHETWQKTHETWQKTHETWQSRFTQVPIKQGYNLDSDFSTRLYEIIRDIISLAGERSLTLRSPLTREEIANLEIKPFLITILAFTK